MTFLLIAQFGSRDTNLMVIQHTFKGTPNIMRSVAEDGVLDAQWPHRIKSCTAAMVGCSIDHDLGGHAHLYC